MGGDDDDGEDAIFINACLMEGGLKRTGRRGDDAQDCLCLCV